MTQIITVWGAHGLLGLIGLYLLIGAAIGRMIRIPPLVPAETTIELLTRRIALGVIGVILALPLVVSAYREIGWGINTTWTAPAIEEFVAPPTKPVALFSPISGACMTVEGFGLKEHTTRILQYAEFQKRVTVGLNNTSEAYVAIGEARRWMKIDKRGDYIDFVYNGRAYRLTCTAIYAAYSGPSSVGFDVCRW